ncbi:uncharacterized protein LOC133183247 [Saccostrea echinata]|uniref:uncharacterized protein LOC133183247 n=1 Tax=Saccostrea echinata TaxID=191078 RepID=UPI002A81E3A9|nr:uncharacterized protein LOC133183247 [Saccostrea echinata]XP_061174187.1 uncharacterized protein LOC133183247 [Saccostrea echinata]XP_061174188.1 uncharacterized protein LOC133183247 [Saccostrea echinata]XP_061174189.1 uncharacterized protein LOC133183247 [Saccostrea echinata]
MRNPCTFLTFSTFISALPIVTTSAQTTCDVPVIPASDTLSTSRYPREAITLECNPSSYDTIEWFFRSRNQTALDPFPFSWCQNHSQGPLCRLYNKNTSLNIEMISKEANGDFLCVASCNKTKRNTSATVILYVEDCFADVPELKPPQNVSVCLEQTATLTCRAHVGKCYNKNEDSFYVWTMDGKRLQNNQKYKIEQKLEGDDLVTTLTIGNVTEKDMTSYNCVLVDNKFLSGNGISTVFLTKKETMTENVDIDTSVIVLSVLLPTAGICLFVFCYIFFYWCFRYHLCRGEKADRGTKCYDVLLYKDDDHTVEATRLRDELKRLMYTVCTPEDSYKGGEMQSLQELIDSSSSVIFFCNYNDKLMDTILSKAQESLSVFVIRKSKESKKISRLRNKSMAGFKELCWPSHRESSFVCVRWWKDEFYYRLRYGLPKPRSDQYSHEEEQIENERGMYTDINRWENEMNKL